MTPKNILKCVESCVLWIASSKLSFQIGKVCKLTLWKHAVCLGSNALTARNILRLTKSWITTAFKLWKTAFKLWKITYLTRKNKALRTCKASWILKKKWRNTKNRTTKELKNSKKKELGLKINSRNWPSLNSKSKNWKIKKHKPTVKSNIWNFSLVMLVLHN